jgi:cell division protein FtsI (penicillin-binding protein 3)
MSDYVKCFSPRRLVILLAIFLVWSLVVIVRLIQFQAFKHSQYSSLAIKLNQEPINITARRGDIYDNQMGVLAASVMMRDVIADPRHVKDLYNASEKLATILAIDPKAFSLQMKNPANRKRLVVKERVDLKTANQVKDLKIQGIYFADRAVRVYPSGSLASHVLGFINMAGDGVAGLEKRYNKEMFGKNGQSIIEVDALGRSYDEYNPVPSEPGSSLVLSIDRDIQRSAEIELLEGIRKAHARAGVAIVMESETGRILALASYPDFDCNEYGRFAQESWRNLAVQQHYEPGSTFKAIILAAALNENATNLDEVIDCHNGSMMIAGQTIHDHEAHRALTVRQIIEKSSNIGAAQLGMRLGYEKLMHYIHRFGFGAKTGVDLPAETIGLVRTRNSKHWSARSIASISFGQKIAATPIQLVTAINAIANGGCRARPSLVDRIVDFDGSVVYLNVPAREQIISAQTAKLVASALAGVIENGTGPKAALEGYRAAGKTGTAQKADGKRLSKTKYLASFVGFAPLPDTRVTVLVQIDDPETSHYGGEVAAPVFQKIAQHALLKLRVPQNKILLIPKSRSAGGGSSPLD